MLNRRVLNRRVLSWYSLAAAQGQRSAPRPRTTLLSRYHEPDSTAPKIGPSRRVGLHALVRRANASYGEHYHEVECVPITNIDGPERSASIWLCSPPLARRVQ